MTIREIRTYPDPVLRSPCAPVARVDDGVRALVRDLLETTDMEGRAGVAAPQIGVGLQAFAWHIDDRTGYVLNPVLDATWGELREIDEGCLSVPGIWARAPRWEGARVRGIDLDGRPLVIEGEGIMSQMLQHETDHLRGTVYLDVLSKEQRRVTLKAVRESDWF